MATAPYFHNGSVPTLYDVLFFETRTGIWVETSETMDSKKVGLTAKSLTNFPNDLPYDFLKRRVFNSEMKGQSNSGHEFSKHFSPSERMEVLEYLKSL